MIVLKNLTVKLVCPSALLYIYSNAVEDRPSNPEFEEERAMVVEIWAQSGERARPASGELLRWIH